MIHRLLVGLVAAGAALAPVSAAFAVIDCTSNGTGTDPINNITIHGGQVNMAGATLFVDFFRQATSTNDWIDADNDGFFGFVFPDPTFQFVDQLSTGYVPGAALDTWWAFNYRSVGSVQGFSEFVDSELCGTVPTNPPSEAGLFNRFQYAALGQITPGFGEFINSSGTPLEQCSIEGSFLDVPGAWAVIAEGPSPKWDLNPTDPGYGLNFIESSTGVVPQLELLSRECTEDVLNFNEANADADTLFNLVAAWVPVVPIASRGAALENVKFTEMQYHFATGRFPNGLNLIAVTRDTGSGTHNAWMNSINIDPSWGRGDNIGDRVDLGNTSLLGPLYQPSNKGGSGLVEDAVQNNRIAFGYTGLAGGSRAARDASRGFYEVLNVCKDVDQFGAPLCDCDVTGYVRPNIDTTLDNCDACTGYQIAGSGSFVVRGNIDANRDPGDLKYNAVDPPVDNQAVADYLNNIFDSIDAFSGNAFGGECGNSFVCSSNGLDCQDDADCAPGNGTCTVIRPCSVNEDCDLGDFCGQIVNSPGQGLAVSFFLPAGIDCLHELDQPLVYFPTVPLNQDLQDYMRANNGLGWDGDTPAYGSANIAGLVPRRLVQGGGAVYTDGQADRYIYWTGAAYTTIAGGSRLSARNRVGGDFNEDFALNINDAAELVNACYTPRAWQQTAAAIGGGATGGDMSADNAIPEVLGDFDGDGHFTKEDLRYFADGLAMVGGQLDRKQGAIAIDNQVNALAQSYPWADTNALLNVAPGVQFGEPTFIPPASIANYLGNTGNAYKPGDFRGDVAGATLATHGRRATAGARPMGWDGKIDAADIDYVCANIRDWSNIDQAVFMDLSCDMNGDLAVNIGDVTELVEGILITTIGDANLNGTAADDLAIVDATIAFGAAGCNGTQSCGWADGDFNCDGIVDSADRGVLAVAGDCDGSGVLTIADFESFANCHDGPDAGLGGGCVCADMDADGDVDLADFRLWQLAL
jgi:hypothetical protein